MLRHADIWAAIDRLAKENGLTASGLARRAGLDPTTFNRSKRMTREGKQRWPSTESIAKILDATGANLGHFVGLVRPDLPPRRPRIPLASLREISTGGDHFDPFGRPSGEHWDEISLPDIADPHAFALEVTNDEDETKNASPYYTRKLCHLERDATTDPFVISEVYCVGNWRFGGVLNAVEWCGPAGVMKTMLVMGTFPDDEGS